MDVLMGDEVGTVGSEGTNESTTDEEGTAVSTVSEIGVKLVRDTVIITATCEGTVDVFVVGAVSPGSAPCTVDTGMVSGLDGGPGKRTALPVPGADDTAGAIVGVRTDCSAGDEAIGTSGDDSGGGAEGLMLLVGICGASCTTVEVVTSVGVTTADVSEMTAGVVTNRARERVHRFPFTVVMDSRGVAMHARDSNKKTPTSLNREDEVKRNQGWQAYAY